MSRKFWMSSVAAGLTSVSAVALADHDGDGIRYDDRYDSLPAPRKRPEFFASTTIQL